MLPVLLPRLDRELDDTDLGVLHLHGLVVRSDLDRILRLGGRHAEENEDGERETKTVHGRPPRAADVTLPHAGCQRTTSLG